MLFDPLTYLVVVGLLLLVTVPMILTDSIATVNRVYSVAAIVALSVLVIPGVLASGTAIAKGSALNYNEYWSGLEKEAKVEVTECSKDGPCHHEYDCDPYIVPVTKTRTVTETVSDGKGGTTTQSRTETYVEMETRWHSCPYVNKEFTYLVNDTLGETYNFGDHLFPKDAESQVWRGYGWERRRLPGVARGVPADWAAVKARLDAGNPGGTTQRRSYKNYVLAAQETVYRKHSDKIEDYLKSGLLPKPASKVTEHYNAVKVYQVGASITDFKNWSEEVQRFNGWFGSSKQGDLHLVFVDAVKVSSSADYTAALEAYWQSKALGKDTLSKNGVVLVLGVSEGKILWSDGFTGMPEGNENVVQAFRSTDFGELEAKKLLAKESPLGHILLDGGYNRVEMENYKYLEDSIRPSGTANFIMGLTALLVSLLLFLALQWGGSKGWVPMEEASLIPTRNSERRVRAATEAKWTAKVRRQSRQSH